MKNKILKAITGIALIILIICFCSLDSDSYLPVIGAIVCFGWLIPFGKINGIIGGFTK